MYRITVSPSVITVERVEGGKLPERVRKALRALGFGHNGIAGFWDRPRSIDPSIDDPEEARAREQQRTEAMLHRLRLTLEQWEPVEIVRKS